VSGTSCFCMTSSTGCSSSSTVAECSLGVINCGGSRTQVESCSGAY
jgi:hypothetical protein